MPGEHTHVLPPRLPRYTRVPLPPSPQQLHAHSLPRRPRADFILFKGWVPCTAWAYALTIVAVLLSCVLAALLRAVRARVEADWRDADARDMRAGDAGPYRSLAAALAAPLPPPPPRRRLAALLPSSRRDAARNTTRAALALAAAALDYSLMLVAMTFNAGLFLAVVGGSALGVLLFGHVPHAPPPPGNLPRRAAPEPAAEGSCCGGTD
jgi:hypothetical protein